jgi:hypothetical protein
MQQNCGVSSRGSKATCHNINQLIVEGDSQVIISLVSKIIHGSNPSKVSPRWRLLGLLEEFRSLL